MDQVLQESTKVAQEAAGMIGGTFEQGVGFKANAQTANNARERTQLKTEMGTPTTDDLQTGKTQITPVSVRPNTAAAGIFGATDALIGDFQTQLANQANMAGQQGNRLMSELDRTFSKLATRGSRTAEIEEQEGIGEISTDLTNITNDLIMKKRSFENEKRALLEAPGLTASQKDAQLRSMERTQAQELADLSIQQLVAQNRMDSAQALVDRKVELEFGDEEARLDALKFFYTENKELFTKAEDRLFQSQLSQQNFQLDMAKTQFQQLEQTKLQLMAQARQNGAPNEVITAIQSAGDIQGAFNSAGEFGIDPIQQLQEEQMRASIANTYSQIADRSAATAQGSAGGLSARAQAVAENPSLLKQYTPTEKGKIIDELAADGYDTTKLTAKPLSDTAIGKVVELQDALDSLGDLGVLIDENQEFVGPISGLQAINPFSQARKLQADVDRVRQTVGKALEGGVLRKEDEEKYKKILATLTDTPSTAAYKIEALKADIQSNLDNYINLQQFSGMKVPQADPDDVGALRSKYNY